MKLSRLFAGLALFLSFGLVSCEEQAVDETNTLSVEPSAPITFAAEGNEDVTLTVTTDADEWEYDAPEWVIATKDGNELTVGVEDNTTPDSMAGRITFTAGNAEPVHVTVTQEGAGQGGDDPEGEDISGSIMDESGETDVKIKIGKETSVTANLRFTLAEASDEQVSVKVYIDADYLAEYDYIHGSTSTLLPESALEADSWTVNVEAGQTETTLPIAIDGNSLAYSTNYLLPLAVEVTAGNVSIVKSASRVNYAVVRQNPKEVKQMVIFEFNDANPLSALEYKLEDGSYFFDAVVLFSGNMGWNANTGRVEFNSRTNEPVINSNTEALISEWQTYLKPIHDAGIKVYMGIMPHHTAAGITTLSYWGCEEFAKEMAQIIHDCQMDGVFLDEEYVGSDGGPMTEEWSTPRASGSYFAYQMSKQMDAVCDWETEVAIYQYGALSSIEEVTDHVTGETHDPAEFADIMVADYGQSAYPMGNQTLKNCSGISLQLNYGHTYSEENARQLKEEGYGWIMYFAFNPDPTHNLYTSQATGVFQEVARGCYDQELIPPTHYYKKIGQGQYDPNRYPYE